MDFHTFVGSSKRVPEALNGTPASLDTSVFLFDFDGTLVDMADRPDGIVVPDRTARHLNDLYDRTGGAVAIVSGRKLDDLDAFLPNFPGVFVGSHGAEERRGDDIWRHPASDGPVIDHLRSEIREFCDGTDILVEHKPAAVVLHFRQAPDRQEAAETFLHELVDGCDGFTVKRSKMALEAVVEDATKGAAAERLVEEWSGRLPVSFGDDVTDESMFEVALKRGGIAVKVGNGDSVATHRVQRPADVRGLLDAWVNGKGGSS